MDNYGNLASFMDVYGYGVNVFINCSFLATKNSQFVTKVYYLNIIDNYRYDLTKTNRHKKYR